MILTDLVNTMVIGFLLHWVLHCWACGWKGYSTGECKDPFLYYLVWFLSPLIVPFFLTLHHLGFVDLER